MQYVTSNELFVFLVICFLGLIGLFPKVIVGFLTSYLTDIRKKFEKGKAKKKLWKMLKHDHAKLFDEMKTDLMKEEFKYHREFFVLSKNWCFNSSGPYLCYYVEEHFNLEQQLKILLSKGLIVDVSEQGKNVKKYQITDAFTDLLYS